MQQLPPIRPKYSLREINEEGGRKRKQYRTARDEASRVNYGIWYNYMHTVLFWTNSMHRFPIIRGLFSDDWLYIVVVDSSIP